MNASNIAIAALTLVVCSVAVSQEGIQQSDIGRRLVADGYPLSSRSLW